MSTAYAILPSESADDGVTSDARVALTNMRADPFLCSPPEMLDALFCGANSCSVLRVASTRDLSERKRSSPSRMDDDPLGWLLDHAEVLTSATRGTYSVRSLAAT